jgi:hypothetical protein
MAFDFLPFREGTLQNEEICSMGQFDNGFGVIRVSGYSDRFPIGQLDSIPDALRGVSHGFREDHQVSEEQGLLRDFCDG